MSPSYVIAGVDLEENSVDGIDFVDDNNDYDDLFLILLPSSKQIQRTNKPILQTKLMKT